MAQVSVMRRQVTAVLSAALVVMSLPTYAEATTQAAWQAKLIEAARSQIGVTTRYDPAYTRLAFPGGDVPRDKGVCTDVVVRAYRDAFAVDLQALVNADMRTRFSSYPRKWGSSKPDPSIDHRRVLNLRVFFQRRGAELGPKPLTPDAFEPGDIATQVLPGNLPHIGIVSDRRADSGRLMLIHNIGTGTEESDVLATYPLTGRYRLTPET